MRGRAVHALARLACAVFGGTAFAAGMVAGIPWQAALPLTLLLAYGAANGVKRNSTA